MFSFPTVLDTNMEFLPRFCQPFHLSRLEAEDELPSGEGPPGDRKVPAGLY